MSGAPRLQLVRAEPVAAVDFAREVERGLTATRKRIPCRFFYDAAGSALFEEICTLPEYYLTRCEDEILAEHADEVVAAAPLGSALVELGSGSARKTRRVIEACLRLTPDLVYVPIDIAEDALRSSSQALLDDYPGLAIEAYAAEYEFGLAALGRSTRPALALWLGSNIGNFDRKGARAFLAGLIARLSAQDRLLVGIDLRKPRYVVEAAYDDARGVTARFNLHLLERINAELGGSFDLARFRHVAFYDEDLGRIEMHLESTVEQVVAIEALGLRVGFATGERIHTEDSYKYSLAEIEELVRGAGARIESGWSDRRGFFRLVLLAPQPAADVHGERAPR